MLKQGCLNVGEYTQKFKTLLRRSELNESLVYTIDRFINVLSYHIAKSAIICNFLTFEEDIWVPCW